MAKRSLITISCYKGLAGSVKSNQVKNRLDDFMLKKAGRAEERERTKLGLCRFRPIINNTLVAEAVFREIRNLSTKALNSMLD